VTATTTLPWSWYSDPAVLALEQERIFARSWQYVGHTGRAAEPGSFFATRGGHMPVVVVLGKDRELRAFLNVCRHRGHVLCAGEGRRETLQCPYHAWTYELDGSLRSAPRSDREPEFDTKGISLLPLAVGTWGPFVFVNPSPEATPLEEALGALPSLVGSVGVDVDRLVFHSRSEGEIAANWKVCSENYLECYHCPVAHPGFSQVVDVSPDAYRLEADGQLMTQVGPVRARWSGDFDPTPGTVERGQFHFLFPNLAVNVMPGYQNLSIGPIFPTQPETTYRFLDYFFEPGAPAGWIADMLAFDDQVGAEDRALVESVQTGVRSGLVSEGLLLPQSEQLISHFQALLLDALA
jgi:choline monooxygenase